MYGSSVYNSYKPKQASRRTGVPIPNAKTKKHRAKHKHKNRVTKSKNSGDRKTSKRSFLQAQKKPATTHHICKVASNSPLKRREKQKPVGTLQQNFEERKGTVTFTEDTASNFMNKTAQEFISLSKELKNRACVFMSSPTASAKAALSMFLYAGSYAVLASCALGTFATVLPVLGITAFPAAIIAVTLIGAGIIGGATGLYYGTSKNHSILPKERSHWTEILSMTNYWRRLNF